MMCSNGHEKPDIDFIIVVKGKTRMSQKCIDCRKETSKFDKMQNFHEYKASSYISTDKKRFNDIKNPIDGDWIKKQEEVFDNTCSYCGRELDNYNDDHGQAKNPDQLSVDRLDSSKPHTKENCIITCWRCNRMKGDMDLMEFVAHFDIVQKNFRRIGLLK